MAAHLPRAMMWTSCRGPNLVKFHNVNKVIRSSLHQGCTATTTMMGNPGSPRCLPPVVTCHHNHNHNHNMMRPHTPPPHAYHPFHHHLNQSTITSSAQPSTMQCIPAMQCALKPSVCEVNDPLGLFLPAARNNNINNNNINNNINNINNNNNNSINNNSIGSPSTNQWIEIIEPALKILEISDPNPAITDPGKEGGAAGPPTPLEMKRKSGFQHRKQTESSRMKKHKRRKRMERDNIQIHEVYSIKRERRARRRAKMREELSEKLEQLAIVHPRLAELKKKRTHVQWRLESW